MVVEAAWRGSAHSRPAIDRLEVDRWPASSRSDWRGGFLHVRKPVRRALYDLLREGGRAADGVTLRQREAIRCILLGRRQDRLCCEWPGRPRAARRRDQDGLRTGRQRCGEKVVSLCIQNAVTAKRCTADPRPFQTLNLERFLGHSKSSRGS